MNVIHFQTSHSIKIGRSKINGIMMLIEETGLEQEICKLLNKHNFVHSVCHLISICNPQVNISKLFDI